MPPVKRTRSRPATRRERAQATRRRMVESAYRLFCERGYSGTTMADIADAAGVAVQTVYFTFNTKARLLSRAYDFAVVGAEEPLVPSEQPWYGQMIAEPDVVAALRLLVTGAGEILRRVAPLAIVAQGTAASDPDVAHIVDLHERRRVGDYGRLVEILAAKAPLRSGLASERARHLLLLFVGTDVYHFLVAGSGWSHEEWIDWAVASVADQVFGVAVR